jgi:hypothetical protein
MTIFLALVAGTAGAEEKAREKHGPPPRFFTVLGVDRQKDEFELVDRTVRFVSEGVVFNTEADKKPAVVTKLMPVYEERVAGTVDLKSAEVLEAGGRELGNDEVWKRIALGKTVVVSADGQTIDSAYLNALAKDTLVIVSIPFAVQLQSKAPPTDATTAYPRQRQP